MSGEPSQKPPWKTAASAGLASARSAPPLRPRPQRRHGHSPALCATLGGKDRQVCPPASGTPLSRVAAARGAGTAGRRRQAGGRGAAGRLQGGRRRRRGAAHSRPRGWPLPHPPRRRKACVLSRSPSHRPRPATPEQAGLGGNHSHHEAGRGRPARRSPRAIAPAPHDPSVGRSSLPLTSSRPRPALATS